jgi:hypothetical protein
VITPRRLALLSLVIAVAAVPVYTLLLRVPLVRNHPEGYVVAFAVAMVLAIVAVRRGGRWSAWIALSVSTVLLFMGAWFDFVVARIPPASANVRVGQPAPDFTLNDAMGRPVSLADFRGRKPVVLVFYRGYW